MVRNLGAESASKGTANVLNLGNKQATMASLERPHREMRQRAQMGESIFGLKALGHQPRPVSMAATEIVDIDSDWEEDDDVILSEVEEYQNSPRASVNSVSLPEARPLPPWPDHFS